MQTTTEEVSEEINEVLVDNIWIKNFSVVLSRM